VANEPRSLLVDDILASAARALASLKGTPVRFEAPEVLSDEKRRNLIVRARAVPDAGRAQSVIIKATRSTAYDPYADTAFESSGLVREWVATAYLASRAPGRGHGASFLTGDVAQGMVVCEDLGAHVRSLVDPLLNGSAEAAERVLLCYAQALGRLHGDTVGCANAHAQTLKSVFGAHGSVAPSGRNFARLAARVEKRMGKSLPAGELAQIADRLGNPGAWQCLVHGDPCPDNALLVAGQVRLIDFEFTRPGHALLDAIYWRIGFPTCWCAGRIPPEVAARIEAAYRAEVGRAMPFALDDRVYDIECAYMTVAWLLFALDWRYEEAVREDAQWGVASLRSRLLWYLEACIDATGKARVLPGIHAAAAVWLADLHRRWPRSNPLAVYPAFADAPRRCRDRGNARG
jgi:Phosphotransferase enzyme family